MGRAAVVAGVLGVALVVSNGLWLYGAGVAALDTGVSLMYARQELQEQDRALRSARAVVPLAWAATDREAFLRAAREVLGEEGFDKDGCTWIGGLGFRFEDGELVHVSRGWSYGEPDPCFPGSTATSPGG